MVLKLEHCMRNPNRPILITLNNTYLHMRSKTLSKRTNKKQTHQSIHRIAETILNNKTTPGYITTPNLKLLNPFTALSFFLSPSLHCLLECFSPLYFLYCFYFIHNLPCPYIDVFPLACYQFPDFYSYSKPNMQLIPTCEREKMPLILGFR